MSRWRSPREREMRRKLREIRSAVFCLGVLVVEQMLSTASDVREAAEVVRAVVAFWRES